MNKQGIYACEELSTTGIGEEIAQCQVIIVSADKNVEMARFDGKPVIQVKGTDGINKAEELINQALSGSVPIYHSDHVVNVENENLSGGIFVIGVISNSFDYFIALIIGMLVGILY